MVARPSRFANVNQVCVLAKIMLLLNVLSNLLIISNLSLTLYYLVRALFLSSALAIDTWSKTYFLIGFLSFYMVMERINNGDGRKLSFPRVILTLQGPRALTIFSLFWKRIF